MDSLIKKYLIFSYIIFYASAATVTTDVTEISQPGVSVTLRCSFMIPANGARVTWQEVGEDGQPLRVIADLSACSGIDANTCTKDISDDSKYSVTGTLSSGFNLVIHELTLEDDGIYECKVIASDGIGKDTVRLIVTSPPVAIDVFDVESGEAVKDGTAYIVIGRKHMLNCSVPTPSNPPPGITWSAGDVTIEPKDQINQDSTNELLMTSSREVAINGQQGDTGKIVSCSAQHPGLSTPLLANVTIEAGNLPAHPTSVEVSKTSITVDSLTVTWLQGNSGGKLQTYTITYCPINNDNECMEESGIQPTVHSLYNLKPSNVYRVTVKSHTVFGYSENNGNVEVATRPLAPNDMGVQGVYNTQTGLVDITRLGNSTAELPAGICFQLVFVSDTPTAEAPSSSCLGLNQGLPMPSGASVADARIVGYGNSVYSAPSPLSSGNSGNNAASKVNITYIIIGVCVSVGVVLLLISVIVIIRVKGNNSSSTSSSRSKTSNRNLPRRPANQGTPGRGDGNPQYTTEEQNRYSLVKYQEVTDPPAHSYDMQMTQGDMTNELYATSENAMEYPGKSPNGKGGQYYSRQIGPGFKGMSQSEADKYGYMQAT